MPTTLTASLTSGATSFAVTDLSSYPASLPYTLAIDADNTSLEVVLVTAITGNTVTACTRGYDGTAAQAHAASATVEHVAVSADYDEANAHVNASSGVHGLAGSVVGTNDTQTLTNKTLTSPAFAGTASGNLTTSGNLQGAAVTATGALNGASAAVSGNATVGGTLGVSGQITAPSKVAPNEMTQLSVTNSQAVANQTPAWVIGGTGLNGDYNTIGATANGVGGKFWSFVVPVGKGGQYRINGQVGVDIHSGDVKVGATKNNSTSWIIAATEPANTSGNTFVTFGPKVFTLSAGDEIRLIANPSAGGGTNWNVIPGAGGADTFLLVERIA